MKLSRLLIEDDAVSSTIGVVLTVAVTVILAAAVGTFALGLAEESTKQTPSASIEVEWDTVGGDDVVDITILGGDSVKSRFVNVVHQDGTELWSDGTTNGVSIYDNKKWGGDEIQSGDTLGLQEDSSNVFQSDDTVKVIWNNGQKSQVLGSGTLN
ncbi:type IV pilin [Halorubellus salinus]|uniref:type IV pilin n=1 Tax=Halorubellus salinus TaxID=755309 RepID=UPI001D065BBA|nr:type IV pilin N-terminal domain-containing protein [Halorubellus salinus]